MFRLHHGHDSSQHHVDRCGGERGCNDEENHVDDVDSNGPATGAGAFFDGVPYAEAIPYNETCEMCVSK